MRIAWMIVGVYYCSRPRGSFYDRNVKFEAIRKTGKCAADVPTPNATPGKRVLFRSIVRNTISCRASSISVYQSYRRNQAAFSRVTTAMHPDVSVRLTSAFSLFPRSPQL